MLGIYDAVMKVVSAIVAALVQLLLIVMVAIIAWMVISRQLLSRAPSWAEEISLVMVIWFGLIGATFGVRDRYHLRMELFLKLMPRGARPVVAYFTDILIVAFGVLLIVGGMPHVVMTMSQTLPATKLPGAIRYLPLPITGALIVLYGFRNLLAGGPSKDAATIGVTECAVTDEIKSETSQGE
jgi:TRAP-type C4-dicarboxylate transport system permease small subunit